MVRIQHAARVALVVAATAFSASTPAAAIDVPHGKIIAQRWCAECHLVSPDQTRAKADAPSFADVASRKTSREISAFLTDPHPRMPDMTLSRDEIADLVGYIKSLGLGPEEPVTTPPKSGPDVPAMPKSG